MELLCFSYYLVYISHYFKLCNKHKMSTMINRLTYDKEV